MIYKHYLPSVSLSTLRLCSGQASGQASRCGLAWARQTRPSEPWRELQAYGTMQIESLPSKGVPSYRLPVTLAVPLPLVNPPS
jgi:hypothetical protein